MLDDLSRNHGLWVEFREDRAVTAELWNHGHQVGIAKRSEQDEWITQIQVNGFVMPEDPVSAWHKINEGYYDPDYARTLLKVEHDTILYGSTLAKLMQPLDEDKAAFTEMIDSLSDEISDLDQNTVKPQRIKRKVRRSTVNIIDFLI